MARRLGWLGPAVVAVGIAAAAVGVWFMVRNKPTPGEVIDTLPLDARAKLVVRAEQGGERSFVELHVDDTLRWRALVPRYAGRPGAPGIAWTEGAVSVRVVRDGKPEIFAVSMRDASKVGGIHLSPDRGALRADARGPVTLTDHLRSYEVIAGEGWNQLVAIDLRLGKVLWSRELGPAPIDAGGVDGGLVWLEQAGKRRFFDVFIGKENRQMELIGPPPTDGVAPTDPGTPDRDQMQPPPAPAEPATSASKSM